MKRIHIVAGIILNSERTQLFITKRPDDKHQGGLWEFPGGKVEIGESVEQAMSRELAEEIGIVVKAQSPFQHFEFDYPDKSLTFDFLLINDFTHQPFGKEGQQGKWIAIRELVDYSFPAANIPIIERVIKEFS